MSTLKVSITPQLRELLGPLEGLLPPELNALVVDTLATSTEIRYSLVVDVSKWAFSDEGKIKLEEKGLNQRDYDRLNLSAGTMTNPSTRLPPPEPKPEPWETARDEKNTRRAIAALVNAVFSMLGIGAAVWWGSKTTGWTDEVRLSMSLLGGLITGLAEAGLFAIYYNKRENEKAYRAQLRQRRANRLKARHEAEEKKGKEGKDGEKEGKGDGDGESTDTPSKRTKAKKTSTKKESKKKNKSQINSDSDPDSDLDMDSDTSIEEGIDGSVVMVDIPLTIGKDGQDGKRLRQRVLPRESNKDENEEL